MFLSSFKHFQYLALSFGSRSDTILKIITCFENKKPFHSIGTPEETVCSLAATNITRLGNLSKITGTTLLLRELFGNRDGESNDISFQHLCGTSHGRIDPAGFAFGLL